MASLAPTNPLLDYVNSLGPDYNLGSTPGGAPVPPPYKPGTPVNLIPGTQFSVDDAAKFGINTKDGMDAWNAMLYTVSGGKSGAPMPTEPAPDYRYQPFVVPRTIPQVNGGGGNFAGVGYNPYRPNPVVRGALPGGSSPTGGPTYSFPGGTPSLLKPGLTTTTKNPNQANRLTTNVAQFGGPLGQAKTQSLTDFTQSFLDDRKKQKTAYDQESKFVDSTYDPAGLEAKLAALSRNRSALGRQAAAEAIRRAGRDANVARMGAGGNTSYLDRAYGDTLGRILLENAQKTADQDRENALYVQGQRGSMMGARRNLGLNYVNDSMLPYNVLSQAQGTDLGLIGQMGQMEDNNTLYDYISPDEAARRNLGMLGDLEQTNRRYTL